LEKKLHNQELHDFCFSPDYCWSDHVKENDVDEKCSTYNRNADMVFVRKHEGKRPLGRCRFRRKYIVNMDLEGIGWQDIDSIRLVLCMEKLLAVLKTVANIQVMLLI
jgi:hypothetical protein